MGGNPIVFDWSLVIMQLIPILIFIGLIVLSIFLIVSITRFLKDKTKNDQELLRKMDELIKVMSRE
ncbi:hypothetical protein Desor_2167 [Desulfosporosinus orientis DSM 765]|uniref:DUF4083 domain-containing protein n=1 Tax=Desulfosporosinus orientis (strain ATCC 19365 / DSM 765 / NCIMB 8382 / VKM B-1628 / Singapore I) TaxID=768706 RepID=G7W8R1_DESOD|nr:hypothetical protein [Desulfosporosinus orientis]AET67771.1 hypothetical protein Desor_2167 [Desulfosporosinus orientis DSM 765]